MKSGSIERIFVGWDQPTLRVAAETLCQSGSRNQNWNLSRLLIVVPGRQTGRRLREILISHAQAQKLCLFVPDIITPSELPERLYMAPSNLAAPVAALCAWLHVLGKLSHSDRELLAPAWEAAGPLSGLALADTLMEARSSLMAEGLSFADAAAHCTEIPGFCDDVRWEILARLENSYHDLLAQAGFVDRDDARREALQRQEIACSQDIWLVGTVDLSQTERALLRAVPSSVVALIAAPKSLQEGFDDVGGLVPQFWHDHPLPIASEQLCFPHNPTEEALRISEGISAWVSRDGSKRSITVGVGDGHAADGLGRRLAARGLPTRSPYGRPLDRVRPAALLASFRDYLEDPSARRFATLVRHPDLENWLCQVCPVVLEVSADIPHPARQAVPPSPSERRGIRSPLARNTGGGRFTPPLAEGEGGWVSAPVPPELVDEGPAPSFLITLDEFFAARLPDQMPEALPPVLEARRKALHDLLAPLHETHTLTDWAQPLNEILETIYGHMASTDDAEGRQLTRSLQEMEKVLQSMTEMTSILSPRLSGRDALAFVQGRLRGLRLPDDFHKDGIEMRGWLELAWDDAPALFLTGLHEGAIPAGSQIDPFLPDTLRRHLGLPDTEHRQSRDAYLLRVILESRPHVRLFAARRGPNDEPRRPSRLLFLCEGEIAARRALESTQANSASQEAATVLTPGSTRRLSPPRPQPLSEPIHRLRVTAFRDYLACPYRFYLNHILKLDEPNVLTDEMTAARFGELLHATLASFAQNAVAESPEENAVQAFLRAELARQTRKNFGDLISAPVRLQVRQAQRRLDAFARWQATQTAQGWLIQHDLAERDLEAELLVDDKPFTLTGRLDRVDYHPGEDRYRIWDYKTGSSGSPPDKKHRGSLDSEGIRPWRDLQLPLYRLLAEANGISIARLEVGYLLLPAELGKTGDAKLDWVEEDFQDAQRCAEDVVRALRQEIFWPPAAPPRYPDTYSPLCLDGSRDRQEWFSSAEEESPPAPNAGGVKRSSPVPPISKGKAMRGSDAGWNFPSVPPELGARGPLNPLLPKGKS